MNRTEILEAARQAVAVDRAATYGEAERNFGVIADLWSAYTGQALEPHDVAAMMILLKVALISGNPRHADSWVDVAGYAACGGEIAGNPDWRLDAALRQYVEPVPDEPCEDVPMFRHREPDQADESAPDQEPSRVDRIVAALDDMSSSWPPADDMKLAEMQASGDSVFDIAGVLDTGTEDVRARWRQLTAIARGGSPAITDAALADLQRALVARAAREAGEA